MSARKPALRAYWSKREQDVMLDFPLGQRTSSDGHWLAYVFNREFTEELTRRGYDVKTLRFSVEVDLDGPRAAEKFATLLAEREQQRKEQG
jgi:hypothetical protein